MAGGTIALFFSTLTLLRGRGSSLSKADAIFWAVIAAILALRYVDIRLGGRTAAGEPATMRHWRRHAAFLSLFGLGVWLASHAAGLLRG